MFWFIAYKFHNIFPIIFLFAFFYFFICSLFQTNFFICTFAKIKIMRKSFFLLILFAVGCGRQAISPETESGQQEEFTVSSSISNKKVNCIAQDADGCIWLGTFWGLNKYDSYNYRQYFCYDDEVGLQDNQINSLHRDRDGRLWVATVNGIAINSGGDGFRRIPDSFTDNRSMSGILETESGDIYFTDNYSLNRYDPAKDSILRVLPARDSSMVRTRFFTGPGDEVWGVQGNEIVRFLGGDGEKFSASLRIWPSRVFDTPNGNIWITDGRNLVIFNTRIRAFVDVPGPVATESEIRSGYISWIFPIGDYHLLFIMQNGRFYLYNSRENQLMSGDDPDFPFELPPFTNISAIFRDSDHNIWFGSEDQGYFVARRYRDLFNSEDYRVSFLKDKTVASVAYQEQNDVLIIATLNDGLYLYDRRSATHTHLPDTEASRVLVDGDGTLWTVSKSLRFLSAWEVSRTALRKKKDFQVRFPLSMAADSEGTIWLGCPYGIVQYLKKGAEQVSTVPGQPYSTYTFTPGMLPLSDGRVLVCSFDRPVKIIDRELRSREYLLDDEQLSNCIRRSVYVPTDVLEDSEGKIWFGTVANGLLCYDPSTNEMKPVPGASCSDIMGILEDQSGNIWVSTMYGIGMLDKKTMSFTNYTEGDGIGGNQFTDRAACALPDGTLVFGGNHGITMFKPQQADSVVSVPVIFEDVKVHNRRIDYDFRSGETLKLNWRQDAFSISFAALNYSFREQAHYYYRMDGCDSDWINAGFSREAYYSNLGPGRYQFRVKVRTQSDSIESEEIVLPIRITAAPWQSAAAYIVYLAAGIAAVWFLMSLRRRKEADMMEKARLEKQKQFYTNVAHEFRSPLTMIAGPLSLLEDSGTLGPEDRRLVRIARRSSSWMTQLVDQFLDLNKLESDTLRLSVRKTDVAALLRDVSEMFSVNAGTKEINFVREGLDEAFEMPVDSVKLTKIVVNMLSNAFKYTPKNGTVRLSFDTAADGMAEIRVSDSGPGIPDSLKEKVFERFWSDKDKGGIGIGLYYSRILAGVHHGRIWAEDVQDGSGACFRLQIPFRDEAYAPEEFSTAESEPSPMAGARPETPSPETPPDEDKPKILVVDDEEDVANYLRLILSDSYDVSCCFDADSALKKAKEEMPALILSDVMMPGKDGCELCRELKSNMVMSHIPVILVTAKASVDNQVAGLEAGADAYVTKPFEPKYLHAVIKSQLDKRQSLQEALNSSTSSEAAEHEEALPLQDKVFLSRLYAVMDESLSNSEVDINRIAEIMKISRTNFYYKVKSLTGETPSTFYRNYKFNKAIALMKEGKYNLTEIAFMTGFSSSSQFSTSFKKHFGVSPKEYRQRF